MEKEKKASVSLAEEFFRYFLFGLIRGSRFQVPFWGTMRKSDVYLKEI